MLYYLPYVSVSIPQNFEYPQSPKTNKYPLSPWNLSLLAKSPAEKLLHIPWSTAALKESSSTPALPIFTILPSFLYPFHSLFVMWTALRMSWAGCNHYTIQCVCIHSQDGQSYHKELVELYVTDIGDHNIILGTDWLDKHNPSINWAGTQVDFNQCLKTCILKNPSVTNMYTHTKSTSVLADASAKPYNPWLWHKDYKVQWKNWQGNLQPVPIQQTAGSRRLARTWSSNQLQVPVALFTKDKEEKKKVPKEWKEQMFEQVFWDDYSHPVRDPNPSDSPSVHIHAGFAKA